MRDAVGLMWMLTIQLVGCYMAYWITPAVIFLLVATLLWQGLFCYANYRVRQAHVGKIKDVSPVIYLLLSVPAVFFPTFSFPIFGWLSVYRLVKIAGITVGDNPLTYYFSFEQEYVYKNSDNTSFSERTNPSTGLVMNGAVDIAGNAYGSSSHNYYR